MKSYRIDRGMLFASDKQEMNNKYLIESINTGRQWRTNQIGRFFQGRNRKFYRVFSK